MTTPAIGTKGTVRTEDRNWRNGGFGIDDMNLREILGVVREGLRYYYGYNDSADLPNHWLNGNGEPYQVDADRMLRDIPQFKRDVDVRGKTKQRTAN
ncbi:hypothetical protein AB0L06_19770 [Spirillospora sp. NPDC052269]